MKNSNKINIIRYDELNLWDYGSILIYFLISMVVSLTTYYEFKNWEMIILMYSFATPLFLYLLNYKSLRKFNVYLAWLIFSFFHLWVYFELKEKYNSDIRLEYYIKRLPYIFLFLVYFQIARIIHIKIKNIELVSPTWGQSYDIYDLRKIKFLDYLFFVIFILLWVIFFPLL